MTPDERRKLDEIYEFMKSLRANPTIPYDVAEAFKLRLGSFRTSQKAADSEDRAINESGTASYTNVLKRPTGYKLLSPGVHIPYYGN